MDKNPALSRFWPGGICNAPAGANRGHRPAPSRPHSPGSQPARPRRHRRQLREDAPSSASVPPQPQPRDCTAAQPGVPTTTILTSPTLVSPKFPHPCPRQPPQSPPQTGNGPRTLSDRCIRTGPLPYPL